MSRSFREALDSRNPHATTDQIETEADWLEFQSWLDGTLDTNECNAQLQEAYLLDRPDIHCEPTRPVLVARCS